MTKLRKLTALLLAGALTLLLLTACSGGGGSSGPAALLHENAQKLASFEKYTYICNMKNLLTGSENIFAL